MNVYEGLILYLVLLNLFVATAYIFDEQIRDFVSRVNAMIDGIKKIWNKEPVRQKPLEDFVGKSHFKMPHIIAAEQEQKRKEILASGKEVETEEIAFNVEEKSSPKPKYEQVADEELDDVFADMRISDASPQYSEEDKAKKPEQADGNTFEDIAKAVETAYDKRSSVKSMSHAGKVFVELDGNELFDRLANRTPEIKKRIKLLMELYLTEDTEVKPVVERNSPARNRPFIKVPDNIADFDIRNYV